MLPQGSLLSGGVHTLHSCAVRGHVTFMGDDPCQELGRDWDFTLLTSWDIRLLHRCWQKTDAWGRDRNREGIARMSGFHGFPMSPKSQGGDTDGSAQTVSCIYRRRTLILENVLLLQWAVTGLHFLGGKDITSSFKVACLQLNPENGLDEGQSGPAFLAYPVRTCMSV